MRLVVLIVVVMAAMALGAGQPAVAGNWGRFVSGVGAGAAYTPDADFDGVGWTVSASLERLVSKVVEIRGRAGVIELQGDIAGERPDATYFFATADVLGLDLVSPTGGIGVYYVDLEKPLTDEGEGSLEFGVNAGIRVLIPYAHGDGGITFDATIHHVFADGPAILVTVGAGWLF